MTGRNRKSWEEMAAKAEYGNWVPKRTVIMPGLVGLAFLGLALLYWVLLIPAVLCFLFSGYFAYARYEFDQHGANVQDRIWESVLQSLGWNGEGRVLDIGCGNGGLAIKLAKEYAGAQVVGVDIWSKRWEYSKSVCERNAEIEGVSNRVTFQKASASALPFDDEYFDAAVSNLVFHEVRDTADKREVIREALRVVKKGGKFAFQDLFLMKQTYGNKDDLIRIIRSWGIRKVEFVETRDANFIPMALKLPFMVGSIGTIGILAGEK